MAAVTAGSAIGNTVALNSYNGTAFTPAVGDLLVVVVNGTGVAGTTWSVTDNNASGTYTEITAARNVKAASADFMGVWVRTATIASAASTTVAATTSGTAPTGAIVTALRVSGMTQTGASAVRSTGKQDNVAAGVAPAPVLNQTPLTTNPIITGVHNAQNPAVVTVRAGYTSRSSAGYNTPATGSTTHSIDSGESSATITYGGNASGTSFGSFAIELDTSSGGATPAPVLVMAPPVSPPS